MGITMVTIVDTAANKVEADVMKKARRTAHKKKLCSGSTACITMMIIVLMRVASLCCMKICCADPTTEGAVVVGAEIHLSRTCTTAATIRCNLPNNSKTRCTKKPTAGTRCASRNWKKNANKENAKSEKIAPSSLKSRRPWRLAPVEVATTTPSSTTVAATITTTVITKISRVKASRRMWSGSKPGWRKKNKSWKWSDVRLWRENSQIALLPPKCA
mmetsp:Transcript_40386/g.69907  ORF Transcript_40386/g.69907 Transcript_40386/m.69907 type:complete len:216 (+) Transcript_40386:960-1607(+)